MGDNVVSLALCTIRIWCVRLIELMLPINIADLTCSKSSTWRAYWNVVWYFICLAMDWCVLRLNCTNRFSELDNMFTSISKCFNPNLIWYIYKQFIIRTHTKNEHASEFRWKCNRNMIYPNDPWDTPLIEWVNECVSKWMNEWVHEWVN